MLSCLCDNACKKSLAVCRKSRALCSVGRILSVPIQPASAEQGCNPNIKKQQQMMLERRGHRMCDTSMEGMV